MPLLPGQAAASFHSFLPLPGPVDRANSTLGAGPLPAGRVVLRAPALLLFPFPLLMFPAEPGARVDTRGANGLPSLNQRARGNYLVDLGLGQSGFTRKAPPVPSGKLTSTDRLPGDTPGETLP
eukprot:15202415-Heterocapsa_arctica.AAC.1